MSLPTVQWSQTGGVPSATEWDVSAELSKRITEDFGISVGDTWSQIRAPGSPTMAGFSDLETTAQSGLSPEITTYPRPQEIEAGAWR